MIKNVIFDVGQVLVAWEPVEAMRQLQNNIGSVRCESDRGLNLNIITDEIVPGRTMYGHQGKAYGMIAAAYGDPQDQTGVVMITNGCDDSTFNSVARIVRALMTEIYEGWLGDSGAYRLHTPVPTPELEPAPTPGPTLKSAPDPTPEPTLPPGWTDGEMTIIPGDMLFSQDVSSTLNDVEEEPFVF